MSIAQRVDLVVKMTEKRLNLKPNTHAKDCSPYYTVSFKKTHIFNKKNRRTGKLKRDIFLPIKKPAQSSVQCASQKRPSTPYPHKLLVYARNLGQYCLPQQSPQPRISLPYRQLPSSG